MWNPKTTFVLAAAMVLAGAAAAFGQGVQPSAKAEEAKLIAVLKSEATQKEKADACRELARIGTKDAIPALAALLGDEKLSHMARYGLETIPDPAVDDALRDALGKLKGLPLVGVIGSIGMRRDAKATDALAGLLEESNPDVVQTAARSLGKIGTSAAAKALGAALDKLSVPNQLACSEALMRCAESLAAQGQNDEAIAIYDRLRALQGPHQVRAGGLRGAVLARGKEGLPILLAAIRGADYSLTEAAARTAVEMPGPDVTPALAAEVAKLPPDKQVLIIQVLGKRGDPAALQAIFAAAKSGEKAVRVAALRAIPEIPSATSVPVLIQLMGDPDREIAQAAKDGLAAMSGPEVDAATAAMLKDPDAKVRAVAIDLLGQRRSASAVSALLKAAEDADESVRAASLKALGDVGGVAELPVLVGLLVKAKSPPEIQAAEGAVSAICIRQARPAAGKVVIQKAVYGALPNGPSADVTKKVAEMVKAGALSIEASNANFGDPANGTTKQLRIEYATEGAAETKTVNEGDAIALTAVVTPPAAADAIVAALAQAPTQPKLALLRILRSVRSPKALEAVRTAAADSNAEVKDTALRALCEWPAVDALPDVAQLARASADPKVKTLALRAYIRLIPLENAAPDRKVAALKDAMALAERADEKKLVLAALGGIPTVGALAVVTPSLGAADLKEEASMAAVAIAEKIVQTQPAQVAAAMEQVAKATANPQVANRAKALLGQAQSKLRTR
jgi:HEAT repeat protein